MTIRDIARASGVSPSAVSLVLNNKAAGRVSAAKQAEILAVASANGFELNLSARSLRGKPRRLIGVAMPSPHNSYYGATVSLLHGHCVARAYSVLFAFWNDYADTLGAFGALLRQGVDGIIAWQNYHPEAARGTPMVMFGTDMPGYDCVQFDHDKLVRIAYEHLRQLGHRRIAFCGNADDSRRKILESLLLADGLPVRPEYFLSGKDVESHSASLLERFFSQPERPTCIFCPNDSIAHMLVCSAQRRGLQVPRDISLLGFDNLPEASWMNPSLTTFDINMEKVAETLIDTLFKRIGQPKQTFKSQKLMADLIIRESTAPALECQ